MGCHSPNRCHSAPLAPSVFLPPPSLPISLSIPTLQFILLCLLLPCFPGPGRPRALRPPTQALVFQQTKSEAAGPLKPEAQSWHIITPTYSVDQNITSQPRFGWKARTHCSMGGESENVKLPSDHHSHHLNRNQFLT